MAIDRSEFAVFVGPFVPDADPGLLERCLTLVSPRRNQSSSWMIDFR